VFTVSYHRPGSYLVVTLGYKAFVFNRRQSSRQRVGKKVRSSPICRLDPLSRPLRSSIILTVCYSVLQTVASLRHYITRLRRITSFLSLQPFAAHRSQCLCGPAQHPRAAPHSGDLVYSLPAANALLWLGLSTVTTVPLQTWSQRASRFLCSLPGLRPPTARDRFYLLPPPKPYF